MTGKKFEAMFHEISPNGKMLEVVRLVIC